MISWHALCCTRKEVPRQALCSPDNDWRIALSLACIIAPETQAVLVILPGDCCSQGSEKKLVCSGKCASYGYGRCRVGTGHASAEAG